MRFYLQTKQPRQRRQWRFASNKSGLFSLNMFLLSFFFLEREQRGERNRDVREKHPWGTSFRARDDPLPSEPPQPEPKWTVVSFPLPRWPDGGPPTSRRVPGLIAVVPLRSRRFLCGFCVFPLSSAGICLPEACGPGPVPGVIPFWMPLRRPPRCGGGCHFATRARALPGYLWRHRHRKLAPSLYG